MEEKLYLKSREIWNTIAKVDSDYNKELELQFELQKKMFNIFQVGSSYSFVFNIFNGDFDFVSDEVEKVLGYLPAETTVLSLMNNMHPDDKAYFFKYENANVEFLKTLSFNQIKKYKAQFDFRIKAKNNTYVRILHQVIQIDFDETNFYRSFGIHTDITHIKKEGVPCFSIIGMDGEPSYYNIQDTNKFIKSYDLFTPREREVLKAIVEGKNSITIANALNISLHTVNAHRKNILNKANCKTPIELVAKAITEGWV